MACEANVSYVPSAGTIPVLGTGQPQGFLGYNDEDFVGWVSQLAKRWGGHCAHTSQTKSVFSGTGPWPLGVETDCAKKK
ncbi:MAG: hypothetical protein ACKPKO_13825, partial [Candidatus Fonsibacter sp.]